MTDYSENFLRKHMPEIIQKTRNPLSLAETLYGKRYISEEMRINIQAQKHEVDQMREIYMYLKAKVHFDCTHDWLKENEPDVFEELETRDAEAAAPQKKRSRSAANQTGDETDNNPTGFPDLKTISSFAKLESWVSEPEISQKLISDLESKLGEDGMEALKKELKDKEPKNCLHFNAKDIDNIRKNYVLEKFLDTKTKAKFPELAFRMFFKKNSCALSGKQSENSADYDEPMNTTRGDKISSGYGSYPSDQSVLDLLQNDDQTADDVFVECRNIRDNKNMQETHYSEMDGQPQPPDQPPNVSPKPETQNTVHERDGSSVGFHTSTSESVKDQTEEPSCSRNEPAPGAKKKKNHQRNLKKKNHIKDLLHDWAMRRCSGSKEESKKMLEQISFTNQAEHRDYPCFTAEKVITYKNPTTRETQIIFLTEGKLSRTTKTTTKATVHYVMFVCGIKRAMLLDPEEPNEREIEYDESFIRINKCVRFIFEAFAPALAVYKKIQKEDLCSLI